MRSVVSRFIRFRRVGLRSTSQPLVCPFQRVGLRSTSQPLVCPAGGYAKCSQPLCPFQRVGLRSISQPLLCPFQRVGMRSVVSRFVRFQRVGLRSTSQPLVCPAGGYAKCSQPLCPFPAGGFA